MKSKFIVQIFILLFLIVNATQANAITGNEIKALIINYLDNKNINSKPIIKENRVFKKCGHELNIRPLFDNFKTVIVSCNKPLKWQITIRTNADSTTKIQSKKKINKISNSIKLITLRNNLKKGEVIQKHDLKFDYKTNSVGNGFFESFDKLVGRKINQNLSKGQVIKIRHLEENFMVSEGQSIIIFSDLYGINVRMQGNALENGHFNELIKVKNISSGKIVQGRVINEKKILINY
ncbi:MAG: flagellar basal body P-ring formation chaperone FlgA [Candidatus Puniceispirillales bacterium]